MLQGTANMWHYKTQTTMYISLVAVRCIQAWTLVYNIKFSAILTDTPTPSLFRPWMKGDTKRLSIFTQNEGTYINIIYPKSKFKSLDLSWSYCLFESCMGSVLFETACTDKGVIIAVKIYLNGSITTFTYGINYCYVIVWKAIITIVN